MTHNYIQEKIFDEKVKIMGGRVIIEDLPVSLARIFSFYKNKYVRKMRTVKARFQPEIPDIHLDFIMNPNFNAIAFIEKGHWFIGINEGTIHVINSLFMRMLSDANILTHIGNCQLEDTKLPLQTYFPSNTVDLYFNNVEITPPKDAVRLIYTRLLSEIAIDFLFAHEYTHLSHGHVSFLQSLENHPFINELEFGSENDQSMPSDYKLTRQTLEYDADSGAVGQGWATIWGRHKRISEVREEYGNFYENLEDALFAWWFAVFSLFQLFDIEAINFEKLTAYYHPQTTIRAHMIMPTMLEYIKIELPENDAIKLLGETIKRVVIESANAFKLITGFDPKEEYLKNIMQIFDGAEGYKRSSEYDQMLLNHWKLLRPQLIPFTKTGLAT